MGTTYNPAIVTDGLVFCVDAANKRSYPGTGTALTDIAGVSNGTLTNGPTFDSANGGSIVLDGSNDEIICGNDASIQITEGSISAWFAANNGNSSYRGIIAKQNAWGLFVHSDDLVTYSWGPGSAGRKETGIDVGDGSWNNVVMTFTETNGASSNNAKIYLNSELVLTTRINHLNHTRTLQLGEANANQHLNGKIAQASVYNRVLTPDEVRQNYEATVGRYT